MEVTKHIEGGVVEDGDFSITAGREDVEIAFDEIDRNWHSVSARYQYLTWDEWDKWVDAINDMRPKQRDGRTCKSCGELTDSAYCENCGTHARGES